MGLRARIATVLSFVRVTRNGANISDVEVDPDGGSNITAEHSAPAGLDCPPLPDDSAVAVPVQGSGRFVVVGYFDPANAGSAEPGEVRLYARDEEGVIVSAVHLKNNGTIEAANENGQFSLQAGGNFVVNGVTIDTAGNITTPASVVAPSIVANGKELADHAHPAGTPPGNTGTNL